MHSPFTLDSKSLWCRRRDVQKARHKLPGSYWQLAPPPLGQTAETAFAGWYSHRAPFSQIVVPRLSLPERVARFQACKQASGRKDLPRRPRREGRGSTQGRCELGKYFEEDAGYGWEKCGSRVRANRARQSSKKVFGVADLWIANRHQFARFGCAVGQDGVYNHVTPSTVRIFAEKAVCLNSLLFLKPMGRTFSGSCIVSRCAKTSPRT